MNGAESLVRTLLASGIDTCFANPGTSEMHFVAALDKVEGMRCILGLAETVVTGCADGYARMTGKPAATLTHCGPGFANSIANVHNARRANAPMVNIVGDHATYHRPLDPPLTTDTEGLARAVSHWVRTSTSSTRVGADAAAAVQAAMTPPGQIATLILPADTAWNENGEVGAPLPVPARPAVAPDLLAHHRADVAHPRAGDAGAVGPGFVRSRPVRGAPRRSRQRREAAHTHPDPTHGARTRARAGGSHSLRRGQRAQGARRHAARDPGRCETADRVLRLSRQSRAWSRRPTRQTHVLARPEQDAVAALEWLADELGAPKNVPIPDTGTKPQLVRGKFEPEPFAHTMAALLPENCIVAEDAVTSGRALFAPTFGAAPHDWVQNTGGAIGIGFPLATGAALACPGRKVVCLQADGAGMYTLQALWTQAREKLDVINVVFANRIYKILHGELLAVGAQPGRVSNELFDLARPTLDWLKLAEGMGVEATRVDTLESFADAFKAASAKTRAVLDRVSDRLS